MSEHDYRIPRPDYSDRRNATFLAARVICTLGHKLLVRPHVELDDGVVVLKRRGGAGFLYCGLHRSLWETSGIMPVLLKAKIPLPYVGMGDNLVHGRLFTNMCKQLGTFVVERPSNRREMLQSALKLRSDVLAFIAHGLDVLVFPEGTRKSVPARSRYGDFFPAAFDAVLEYERHRDRILAANPGLTGLETYIVPFNVDYSLVREATEMVFEEAGTPRTLHVLDSVSMLRGIGDTYISFGAPVPVRDHLDLDRKGLASLGRQRCLDLVKILPVNVASAAMLTLPPAARVAPAALDDAVGRVVSRLLPCAERFRGFSAADPPAEIVRRGRNAQLDFCSLTTANAGLYRLYASYIRHLLESDRQG